MAADGTTRRRSCGMMESYNRLLETDPELRGRLTQIEEVVQKRLSTMKVAKLTAVTVPVVVHVVHSAEEQNISDAQVHSQIEVLNADFNARNTDLGGVPAPWKSLVGDAKITFKLATVDPAGAATTGIVRQQTTVDEFYTDDGVKARATGGSDPWAPDQYLNIWVCNLGDGVLGYAQFPGGKPETDGVVILHSAFGTTGSAGAPFDRGRTTTHEVGHWLNLRHIWGDTLDCSGTDHVSDTPRQKAPNYEAPTFPSVSCSNGPNGDMFMNYMDYVDDVAMFMFTSGQVARMRATLSGARRDITKNAAQRTA